MDWYYYKVVKELRVWQRQMIRKASWIDNFSKKWQDKINGFIPEKAHAVITAAVKNMFRAVLFGSEITSTKINTEGSLQAREVLVTEKINFYRKTAAVEGGITGAGGLLLGLADFPLFLAIKIKLLFEIAALYGFDTTDYKERLYLLYIFQLVFSSQEKRKDVYLKVKDWESFSKQLPDDIHQFEWRTFQQEYRDYIDLAKMAQLIPVIGAPVGVVVNYHLITKMGKSAMNAYRIRLIKTGNNISLDKPPDE